MHARNTRATALAAQLLLVCPMALAAAQQPAAAATPTYGIAAVGERGCGGDTDVLRVAIRGENVTPGVVYRASIDRGTGMPVAGTPDNSSHAGAGYTARGTTFTVWFTFSLNAYGVDVPPGPQDLTMVIGTDREVVSGYRFTAPACKAYAALSFASSPGAGGIVRVPGKVQVRGALTGPLSRGQFPGLADRPVQILYRPLVGNVPWGLLKTVRTDGAGNFSATFNPGQHAYWSARYAGTADEVSDTDTSHPPSLVYVQLSSPTVQAPTSARAGTTVLVRGALQPGPHRPAVRLQWLQPSGRAVDLTGSISSDATGAYAIRRAFPNRGTFTLRVLGVESAKQFGSASRVFTVKVV